MEDAPEAGKDMSKDKSKDVVEPAVKIDKQEDEEEKYKLAEPYPQSPELGTINAPDFEKLLE